MRRQKKPSAHCLLPPPKLIIAKKPLPNGSATAHYNNVSAERHMPCWTHCFQLRNRRRLKVAKTTPVSEQCPTWRKQTEKKAHIFKENEHRSRHRSECSHQQRNRRVDRDAFSSSQQHICCRPPLSIACYSRRQLRHHPSCAPVLPANQKPHANNSFRCGRAPNRYKIILGFDSFRDLKLIPRDRLFQPSYVEVFGLCLRTAAHIDPIRNTLHTYRKKVSPRALIPFD